MITPALSTSSDAGTIFERSQVVWFESLVLLLILVSVMLVLDEILLGPGSPGYDQMVAALGTITVLFAIELSMRLVAATSPGDFLREYWPDLLALLPGLQILRFGRAFRLLRLLRLVRVARVLRLVVRLQNQRQLSRVAQSVAVLAILLFTTVAGTVLLAAFERLEHTGLWSLWDSFWSVLFSFFSAQYVQEYPESMGGRVTLLAVIVSGSIFFAVLTATISAVMISRLREGSAASSRMLLREMRDHIVICGWNAGVETALREFQMHPAHRGREIVVISDLDELPQGAQLPHPEKVRRLAGDFTRVAALRKAHIERATLALVVSDTGSGRSSQDADARTVVACLTIEKLAADAITCAELASSESEPHLRLGKVDEIVLNGELSGSLLAQAAIDSAAARVIHNLLHPSAGSCLQSLPLQSEWEGCAFTPILERCRNTVGAIPIAVRTSDGRLLINPDSYELQPGDQLLGVQGSSVH